MEASDTGAETLLLGMACDNPADENTEITQAASVSQLPASQGAAAAKRSVMDAGLDMGHRA
eukprot:3708468-Prorocentrum_lima.AAC.1